MSTSDVIIIGAGAAGLMCALTAGQRGRKVLVLERANKVGKKILMSGGGRCNFTNLSVEPENFLSHNPHFCKSALNRYSQWDFIALVEKHGIPYHEKALGQLFCDHSSKDILKMLLKECRNAKVQIQTDCEIADIEHVNSSFQLQTSCGTHTSASLVVASGGLSIPKMGGSDLGYRLARQFNIPVYPTRAALVPFTITDGQKSLCERLAGVSTTVCVQCGKQSFRENMLFTHRGLSGPAMLQISSYWHPGDIIKIDLFPDSDVLDLLKDHKRKQPRSLLRNILKLHLPNRLVLELEQLWWTNDSDKQIGEWTDENLGKLAEKLHNWTFKPSGTEGYRTTEVTMGGVDTRQLSSKTMECVNQPGLYFIGEVVDVTGQLGGYNFQWAWSSGYAAGQYV